MHVLAKRHMAFGGFFPRYGSTVGSFPVVEKHIHIHCQQVHGDDDDSS